MESYFEEIASHFVKFRQTEFLCDTVLVTDDKELKAHSLLLAAASPLFRSTFEASGEPGFHYINLPGYDSTVVEIALNVIYTGDLVIPKQLSDGQDLLELCKALQSLGLEVKRLPDCHDNEIKDDSLVENDYQATLDNISQIPGSDCTEDDSFNNQDSYDNPSNSVGIENIKISTVPQKPDCEPFYIKDETAEEINKGDPCAPLSVEKIEPHEFHENLSTDCFSEMDSKHKEAEVDCTVYESAHFNLESGKVAVNGGILVKKLFVCTYCKKTFNHPNYLEVHKRTHTGEKPFICNFCGRCFSQRANLNRHALGHSGEKPNLCHVCGKAFIQKAQLDDHLNQHSDRFAFICRFCTQSFNERSTLRQHVFHEHPESRLKLSATGTLTKANVCGTCGKSYSTIGGLRMHTRIHTGQVVACTTCGKVFVNRALLLQHMRGHTKEKSYECGTCGKAFVYKNALTVHSRVHTGEKPYKCTVCGSRYVQFGHLQSHKKTHTGEKPFSCSICAKAYRQKVDLRLHVNRVHKEGGAVKTENTSTPTPH